jgi:hypothetical protein
MIDINTLNLIQRNTAIFALLFLTIYLTFYKTKISKNILNINLFVIFALIFIQPILVVISRYLFNSNFDPFYMYTDMCALCGSKYEYMINFLRISFYSVCVATIVPFLKNMDKWLKNNFKIFEYLFFVGFYSLSIYLYNTGPIVKTNVFLLLFWICQVFTLVSLFKRIKETLLK